jgi:dTDP-4-amino-4,6-dideoxygalactose transaminase
MSGKHHATGPQGGVVFTRDEDLYWRCKRFSDRGKPFHTDAASNVRAGLNLNGNDLAAAIGRVQLTRLGDIIAGRRRFARAVHETMGGLKSVSPGREVPETEGVYWFMRFRVDEGRLTASKDEFARAVAAEGIPVNPSYRHIPCEAEWFQKRRVFPPSDYPWGLPAYGGDRDAVFSCPQAVEAAESHFTLSIHENLGESEAADVVAALTKVEKAFSK